MKTFAQFTRLALSVLLFALIGDVAFESPAIGLGMFFAAANLVALTGTKLGNVALETIIDFDSYIQPDRADPLWRQAFKDALPIQAMQLYTRVTNADGLDLRLSGNPTKMNRAINRQRTYKLRQNQMEARKLKVYRVGISELFEAEDLRFQYDQWATGRGNLFSDISESERWEQFILEFVTDGSIQDITRQMWFAQRNSDSQGDISADYNVYDGFFSNLQNLANDHPEVKFSTAIPANPFALTDEQYLELFLDIWAAQSVEMKVGNSQQSFRAGLDPMPENTFMFMNGSLYDHLLDVLTRIERGTSIHYTLLREKIDLLETQVLIKGTPVIPQYYWDEYIQNDLNGNHRYRVVTTRLDNFAVGTNFLEDISQIAVRYHDWSMGEYNSLKSAYMAGTQILFANYSRYAESEQADAFILPLAPSNNDPASGNYEYKDLEKEVITNGFRDKWNLGGLQIDDANRTGYNQADIAVSAGTSMILRGRGFTGVDGLSGSVEIDGVPVDNLQVVNDTLITFEVPAAASNGTHTVDVTNPTTTTVNSSQTVTKS